MYCKNCGKQIQNGEICKDCENIIGTTVVNDGEKFEVVKEVGSNNNTNNDNRKIYYNNSVSQKSKVAAGLFGIFLGSLGIHNFYLGYTGKGIAQLLITILSCGTLSFISAIWGLIEGILILTGDMKDSDGNDLKD